MIAVVPRQFESPPRSWGLAVQLYAARSARSWGIGDFSDLAFLARRMSARGAGALLVSPLHAARPGPQQPSPYSPASRRFLNVLHIAPELMPGAFRVDLSDLAQTARALNAHRLIDRDAVYAVKLQAFERVWAATRHDPKPEFDKWVGDHEPDITQFATWCALAERHPGPWWEWPPDVRHPEQQGVADFAAAHEERVQFWIWTQWAAALQLDAACEQGIDIVGDVAVGFDAGGADAWAWQDDVCFDFEIGCPADHGNPDGQVWGLPPFDPAVLADADYAPFITTARAAFGAPGALRMDHVMGLWRLFWVPSGGHPDDGAYVHGHGDALLGILRLEAHRAGGAWLVGEDMGTVEPRVIETLAATGALSYRVACRGPVAEFPERCMAACETHDQPTIAGIVDESDVDACHRIGKRVDEERSASRRAEILALAGIDPDAPVTGADIHRAIVAAHRELASSPARLVMATLDDLAAVSERPNMPTTVDTWPNWRLALPHPIEQILESDLARASLGAIADR